MVLACRQVIFPTLSAALCRCVSLSFPANLHLLPGRGELTAGGTGYTLQRLPWIKRWAHDHLQWWQAALEGCSGLFLLLCFYTFSAFFGYVSQSLGYSKYLSLCLVPTGGAFQFFHYFLCTEGPGLLLEYLLLVDTSMSPSSSQFSFQSFIKMVLFLFSISSSSVGKLLHPHLPCIPPLLPGNLSLHWAVLAWLLALLTPGARGFCLLPAWFLPIKSPCFPTSSQFSREPRQCN